MDDLIALERSGWEALSRGGEAARKFYVTILDEHVEMLFPGGMRLQGREAVLESMDGAPWESFDLEELRVVDLGAVAGVVMYRATAERNGARYVALVSSTYVRRSDGWKLIAHQQTPV